MSLGFFTTTQWNNSSWTGVSPELGYDYDRYTNIQFASYHNETNGQLYDIILPNPLPDWIVRINNNNLTNLTYTGLIDIHIDSTKMSSNYASYIFYGEQQVSGKRAIINLVMIKNM